LSRTKERILTEAFRLFSKHGYRGVSVNQIVEKVGITKGGFYHYFSSKDELFIEGMEQFVFQSMEEMTDSIFQKTGSVKQFLQEYFLFPKYYFQWMESIGFEDIKGLYMLMFNGLDMFPGLFNRMLDTYKNQIDMITELLKKGKENGEIRKDLPEYATALQVISTLEGLFFVAMALDKPEINTIDIYLESMFDTIWRGIMK
jgi:AcrR family transcriptional regulator